MNASRALRRFSVFALLGLAVASLSPREARAQDAGVPPVVAEVPLANLEVPPLPAPPARRVNLTQALTQASDEASDARLAEIAVQRAQAAERMAFAGLLPNVNGIGSVTLYDSEVVRAGAVIRPQYGVGLDLQVQESVSLRTWNATRIAAANTRTARLRSEDARRLLRSSVARVYFAVLTARRNAELARTQLASALRQDEAVGARVEAGAAVPLDRARSQIGVLEARQRVESADSLLAQQWDQLGQALGVDDAVEAEEAPAPEQGEPLARYLDRALGGRTDLRALEATRDAARLQIDDAWMRFAPSLSLTWTGGYHGPATFSSPTTTQWSAVASLVVPIFDGGLRYGALADARAQVADAEERATQLRRSVRVQVRDAFRRAETAGRTIVFAEQSVALSRQNLERAELAYQAGAATGVELDDARRQLEQAETTLLLRSLDRQLAMIDLMASAGML
jgi:outer membrane protein